MNRRTFTQHCFASLGGLAVSGFSGIYSLPYVPTLFAESNTDRFERIMAQAQRQQWQALPIGERVCAVAMEFLGTPYVAGTLEGTAATRYQERCTADLTGLDCVTFFETALCVARCIGKGITSFEGLLAELMFTRYRGGTLKNYTSRLHYTSEWFQDNERKGVVRNVTRDDKELRGKAARLRLNLDFMSAHAPLYPALKASPDLASEIRSIEQKVSAEEAFVIPLGGIRAAQAFMRSGDIVGIATSKAGLDYTHTGLVKLDTSISKQGVVRFLHASQKQKKVVLDDELAKVVAAHPAARGITIVRPLEV
jgi:hypothetical protein